MFLNLFRYTYFVNFQIDLWVVFLKFLFHLSNFLNFIIYIYFVIFCLTLILFFFLQICGNHISLSSLEYVSVSMRHNQDIFWKVYARVDVFSWNKSWNVESYSCILRWYVLFLQLDRCFNRIGPLEKQSGKDAHILCLKRDIYT
jgi:hypothetical protein